MIHYIRGAKRCGLWCRARR